MHTVNLGELDSFVTDMSRFDAHVERQLRGLDAQMARLHAVWVGAAADGIIRIGTAFIP